jgi:predicted O-methyltransferase YrrM
MAVSAVEKLDMSKIKTALKAAVDSVLVPPVIYLVNKVVNSLPSHSYSALDELNARTARECAEYLAENMILALQFDKRETLWDHAIANKIDGLIAEFGVASGYSINYLARKLAPQIIYGFDSFEGLRVDWAGAGLTKGAFDRAGKPPKVEKNVSLFKGWFDETVPEFISKNALPFALIHIDCDTYEATKIVLEQLKNSLAIGTIIIFDEYFGFRGWRFGEYKAWQELVEQKSIGYEYIGFSRGQVSVRITKVQLN